MLNTKEYPGLTHFNLLTRFREELLLLLSLHYGQNLTLDNITKFTNGENKPEMNDLAEWLINQMVPGPFVPVRGIKGRKMTIC